ncbi:MAG: oligoendopeptidase F [Waddliaceae bacterium]
MTIKRTDVKPNDCWNTESLYLNLDAWKKDFDSVAKHGEKPLWPKIAEGRGKLNEKLKSVYEEILSTGRKIEKLYTWAHLKHDEDIAEDSYHKAFLQISQIYHAFAEETSWFEPELLSLPNETLQKLLNSKELESYKFAIEKIIRLKPHTLPAEQSKIIALAGQSLDTARRAFSAMNDADLDFGFIQDQNGDKHELTHGKYQIFMRGQDRVLRKNAFYAMQNSYMEYENTLSSLIQGQVQAHHFYAHTHHYPSCLSAALYPKNIDTQVYANLIQTTNQNLESIYKYMRLRKRLMGLDELHLYDLSTPLCKEPKANIPYEEAVDLVVQSVGPLGSEYQGILEKGLKKDRWVDRFENQNKRSGAYSSGCYDSMPYMLMNYNGTIRDVFTLAHEAGHSMHSYYSNHEQPYQYANYPIFLAEIASTFNEDLLTRYLIENSSTPEEKAYYLNQKIDDLRATFFRQTMFAEFELFMHECAEKNIPLTPTFLKEEYYKLNQKYFGKDVVVDQVSAIEWARIPHFYYNFYVYQYATGVSAALDLSHQVQSTGDSSGYLKFLKGGSHQYPLDLLKTAGVDLRSKQPILSAIQTFDSMVDELENSLSQNFTPSAN